MLYICMCVCTKDTLDIQYVWAIQRPIQLQCRVRQKILLLLHAHEAQQIKKFTYILDHIMFV